MQEFKTESKKLLDLMINSIYTNKEIFLRELISNASDAVDKLYFKSLTDDSIQIKKDDLAIRISYDRDARVITISDNGIGMTKEELDRNLGTIAHSDSLEFKSANAEQQGEDVDIIGQFGVGFYSAFMVAKEVRVVSRSITCEEAWAWESDGIEGFTISEADRVEHGTDIMLFMKDSDPDNDYDQYLDEVTLQDLIKRYSNYVRYPIQMTVSKEVALPKPEDAPADYETQYQTVKELETINSMIPIWKRSKSEVSDEEYNEFYKSEFHDFADPVRHLNIRAEGALNYDALLFIPGRQPYDLYTRDFEKGLALYSSNVLIMEKCADLLPDCFGFVCGIVDSQDLSLNISRETLQQNSQLRAMARRIEKKIKAELADMRDNDREAYEKFFEDFGRMLKLGIYSTYGQQSELLGDLLLFYSAKQQKMVTLDEYLEVAAVDQKAIYYAAGESVDRLVKQPAVTSVLNRGLDVLLCTDEVDVFCLTMLQEYGEKELKNVTAGDLGLETEEEKAQAEEAAKANEALLAAMKELLPEQVTKVVVSTRLGEGDTPACVTAAGMISLEMERIMASNPTADQRVKSEHVLELNPNHAVFATLQAAQEAGDTEKVKLYSEVLYDQALMVEGLPLTDPLAFAQAISALLV